MNALKLSFVSILLLLSACSTTPNSLLKPSTPTYFALQSDAFSKWKVRASVLDGGLRAGKYYSAFVGSNGTYYQGPGKSVVLVKTDPNSQWIGGIWIPANGDMTQSRLWRYVTGMGEDRWKYGIAVGIGDKLEEGNLQIIHAPLPAEITNQISVVNGN